MFVGRRYLCKIGLRARREIEIFDRTVNCQRARVNYDSPRVDFPGVNGEVSNEDEILRGRASQRFNSAWGGDDLCGIIMCFVSSTRDVGVYFRESLIVTVFYNWSKFCLINGKLLQSLGDEQFFMKFNNYGLNNCDDTN